MNTTYLQQNKTSSWQLPFTGSSDPVVIVGNGRLTIDDVVSVARHGTQVRLTDNAEVIRDVQASCDYVSNAVEKAQPIDISENCQCQSVTEL